MVHLALEKIYKSTDFNVKLILTSTSRLTSLIYMSRPIRARNLRREQSKSLLEESDHNS